MANFPVPFQGSPITQGVASGLQIRGRRKDRKLQREQLQFERQFKAAEQLVSTIEAQRSRTVTAIGRVAEGLRQAAANGAGPAQLMKIRKAGDAFLANYATFITAIQKQAVESGNMGAAQVFGDPGAFVQEQRERMGVAVEVGQTETGAARGAQTAEEQTALVQRIAENLGITVEQAAQAAGIAPGPGSIRRGMVGGDPAFVRQEGDRLVEVPGATPIPQGMSVSVGPDGGITLRTGEQLGKPTGSTLSKLQQSVIDSNDGIARLVGLQRSFDPDFLTFAGKIKGGWQALKDKAGVDLTADEKRFLTDFTAFSQQAADNMNRYIKEITGAQMSEVEADRLRKGIPDPERDGPTEFQAKMDTGMEQLMLARARSLHVLRQGLEANPWDVIGLDEMSRIIDARVAELEQKLGDRNAALQQAAKEFGL